MIAVHNWVFCRAHRSCNTGDRKSKQQRHFLNVSRPAASLASAQPCFCQGLERIPRNFFSVCRSLNSRTSQRPIAEFSIQHDNSRRPRIQSVQRSYSTSNPQCHHARHPGTGLQEEDAQTHARPRPGAPRPARREAPRRVQGCKAHRRPAWSGAELLQRMRKVF